jgi:hypothetical protein
VSEKDFYSTRPVSVITFISSQCQRKTSVVQKSFSDTGRRWKLLQRRVVWSRSISLTLRGDESYYRDGSCEVEVFLWHWEEMKFITETGHVVQKSFYDTGRRWKLLQRRVVWSRNLSLTRPSPPSVIERLLHHMTRLCNKFHLLPVSEKDFYFTRPVSVVTFISSQCQRNTSTPHDPSL